MKHIKNIVAVTGKYKDRNGEEKNQYFTLGKLFEREDGSQVIKVDTIPMNWDGWANLYDPKKDKPEKKEDDFPF